MILTKAEKRIQQELARTYGTTWFDSAGTALAAGETRRVDQIKDSLARSGQVIIPSHAMVHTS